MPFRSHFRTRVKKVNSAPAVKSVANRGTRADLARYTQAVFVVLVGGEALYDRQTCESCDSSWLFPKNLMLLKARTQHLACSPGRGTLPRRADRRG
jgi:hypothetical protein